MKFVLTLIILGVVGFGGWYAYSKRPAQAAASSDGDTATLDGGTTPAAVGGSSAPVLTAPVSPLPPEIQQAIASADALWNQAGATPATSASAPQLSRLYSAALRAIYNKPGLKTREEELVRDRLTPLGDALFFSTQRYPDDGQFAVHTVTAGQSPDAIAKKYGMTREFVNRLRGKDANDAKLRIGDSLKVIRLAGQTDAEKRGFFLHVDKGDYYLDCFVAGMFARRYLISHGAAATPTPSGVSRVTNRVWHGDWTHPITHQVIRYGDPEHWIGPVWLPIDGAPLGKNGLGFHGYSGPDAKWGAMVSNGCIRMPNDKAEELFFTVSHPDRSPIAVEIVD